MYASLLKACEAVPHHASGADVENIFKSNPLNVTVTSKLSLQIT